MKKLVFLRCNVCGNVVIKLVDKKVPVFCCGQMMQEINVNSVDAAVEKHVPVVKQENNVITVKVGEVEHPMTTEHYISHIIILTDKGYYVREFIPGDKPETTFSLAADESLEKVYSICNLHGVWSN